VRSLLVVSLIGCGRLGFDDVASPLPADDAPANAIEPNICDPRSLGSIPINGETATKLRATSLSTGHAVAIETTGANVFMVRTDGDDAVVATTLPFPAGYTLHGISQIADRPFVYVFTAARGYIKLLIPDWTTYETGPAGDERSLDPQQALIPDRTAAIFGVINGGTLGIQTIDANNTVVLPADYSPPATFASFATTPSGARVVVEASGTCETFVIGIDGVTKNRHTFSPCFEPRLAAIDDVHGAVLHQISPGGAYALHAIPAEASAPGTTIALETGSNGRIAAIDDAIWVAYLRSSGEARLVRHAETATTTRDYPAITTMFDLLADKMFWVDTTGLLSVGKPCTM
jgi:hypothetical protein